MIRKQSIINRVLLATALLVSLTVSADTMRSERVQFAKGETGTVVEGVIIGYDSIDYLVGARAGQVMSVELETDNLANYFNVIPPNEQNVAVFIGSTSGGQFSQELDRDGDWKIRVYQMRSAARRDETANFSLSISVTSDSRR